MRVGTLAYVPGAHFGYPETFLQNLRAYPAKHPMVTFGHHWPDVDIKIGNPEIAKSAAMPCAMSGLVFFTACRIALSQGWDYMIFLEPDCRVSQAGWDDVLFQEFLQKFDDYMGKPVVGGSVVIYSPFASGNTFAKRFHHWYCHTEMKEPCPIYGGAGPKPGRTLIYPNGAIGIYNVHWLQQVCDLNNTLVLAYEDAWDIVIAKRVWNQFGINVFDGVVHLNTILSSCGNSLSTEDQRLAWARSKRFLAVHQVKSNRNP